MRLLLPFLLALTANAQLDGLTVSTQQGIVLGTHSSPTVRQFLGIPYATAGRWQAPQLPPVRQDILNTNSFGDSCVQALNPGSVQFLELGAGGQGLNTTDSENCLTVNVWSPSTERKQKTAVMLWMYGGSAVFGTSNMPIYIGNNFVRDNDDITVVTFNYRLNIFGQPNAPQLVSDSMSQNFGLLDLDAAVTWVHDNIANFGGDPERITLFGESAGAISVDQYTFAHPQDTKVKGVILQSGLATIVPPPNTFDPTPWNNVAQAIGCGNNNDAAQLQCMKAVPFGTLQSAVLSTNSTFNRVVDNISVFSDTLVRAAAGNFLRVPALIGNNANEADIFLLIEELDSLGAWVPILSEALSDVLTLILTTCPISSSAINRRNNAVPIWRYQYQAVFPDISTRPELRSFHASEIPIVFGTYNTVSSVAATADEIALSAYMQSAWAAFARNPQQGLVDFGWPMYNPTTKSLVQLGNTANKSGVILANGLLLDTACGALDVLNSLKTQLEGLLGVSL